jgi:Na+-driven multidrug efflux pump
LLSAYLQNNKKSILTMISGFICIICNTLLNWLLIYGIGIFPELGVKGAAIATMVTQYVGCTILIIFAIVVSRKSEIKLGFDVKFDKKFIKTNMIIALPLIITEFMWSLGESIYAGIYGHMSNEAMAAMANISPVISLSIGFFSIYKINSFIILVILVITSAEDAVKQV